MSTVYPGLGRREHLAARCDKAPEMLGAADIHSDEHGLRWGHARLVPRNSMQRAKGRVLPGAHLRTGGASSPCTERGILTREVQSIQELGGLYDLPVGCNVAFTRGGALPRRRRPAEAITRVKAAATYGLGSRSDTGAVRSSGSTSRSAASDAPIKLGDHKIVEMPLELNKLEGISAAMTPKLRTKRMSRCGVL
jgi:hypothetical protein